MDIDGGAPYRLLRRMNDVLEEARRSTTNEVPPRSLARGLFDLIPGVFVSFSELDLVTRRQLQIHTHTGQSVTTDKEHPYWRLQHQHPTCHHGQTTGALEVVQSKDFVTPRQLHQLEIYQVMFKLSGIEHIMNVPLPTAPGRTRVFLFGREAGTGFTETERLMCRMMQPHLYNIYRRAAHRRRTPARLTSRQLQVLRCVALGMSNDEIAAQLIIAPGTVTKHLENTFARLGVASRTAAIARVFGENETDPPV